MMHGRLTNLLFAPTEKRWVYASGCMTTSRFTGVPVSLYSDKHGSSGQRQGRLMKGGTQFSRAARDLGTRVHTRHSPQAKGAWNGSTRPAGSSDKRNALAGFNNSAQAMQGCLLHQGF